MQSVEDYYRFCPNEPHLPISDAVCLGRRRSSYPYCRGCQFNDDERGTQSVRVLTEITRKAQIKGNRLPMIEKIFKAYDVRATYPDMINEDAAWRIGMATASFLHRSLSGMNRVDATASALVVGRDMRKSSPSLASALIEGMRAAGAPVIDIGMIDTPQIYFAINRLKTCGGVQTTASHNPANYNGFKISGARATPIGSESGLSDICKIAQSTTRHETGRAGDYTERDMTDDYKAFVRGFLKTPKKLRLCVDASNGMAGKWAPILFGDIPELELICLNLEHDGEFVHEPNPLVDENLAALRKLIQDRGADAGICFDGDADRLIVVDERGGIIRCDILTALMARRFLKTHPGSTVVYDLRSSRVVADEIKAAGGVPRRERVGHAFMKKTLADTKGVFGGELSGHFYFRDNFFCDSGMLAMVHLINTLTENDQPLSALIEPLKRYHSSGERNFRTDDKDGVIAAIAKKYADGKVDYLDGVTVQYGPWWFNVRKSNTEPLLRLNLEANSAGLLEKKLAELSPLLGDPVKH